MLIKLVKCILYLTKVETKQPMLIKWVQCWVQSKSDKFQIEIVNLLRIDIQILQKLLFEKKRLIMIEFSYQINPT